MIPLTLHHTGGTKDGVQRTPNREHVDPWLILFAQLWFRHACGQRINWKIDPLLPLGFFVCLFLSINFLNHWDFDQEHNSVQFIYWGGSLKWICSITGHHKSTTLTLTQQQLLEPLTYSCDQRSVKLETGDCRCIMSQYYNTYLTK